MKKCDPKGRDCIEKYSAETFNCSTTCEGMYADISWKATKMEDEKDKKQYEMLTFEYEKFKKENVKHFRFSSKARFSNFGKKILFEEKH